MSARPKKDDKKKHNPFENKHGTKSEFMTHPMFVPTTASAYESPFCGVPLRTGVSAGDYDPRMMRAAASSASEYGMPSMYTTASNYCASGLPPMYATNNDYGDMGTRPMYATDSNFGESGMHPTCGMYDPYSTGSAYDVDQHMHHTSELYPNMRPSMTAFDIGQGMAGPHVGRTDAWYENFVPGHPDGGLFKKMIGDNYPRKGGWFKPAADCVDAGITTAYLMGLARAGLYVPEWLYTRAMANESR